MVLLTPTTFEINFCGQREGTSPRTSITAASCQRALTTKAGGTNACVSASARARGIHARMRTVFRHDGGSENRKTGGAVARRASDWNNTPRREIPFGALHVSKRSRPPVANFVMA